METEQHIKIEINCNQCGSDQYRILDRSTGEVMCEFCRNQWIIPDLKDDPKIAEQEGKIKELQSRLDSYKKDEEIKEEDEEKGSVFKAVAYIVIAILFWIGTVAFESCSNGPKVTATVIETSGNGLHSNNSITLEFDTKDIKSMRTRIWYDYASRIGYEDAEYNLNELKVGDTIKIRYTMKEETDNYNYYLHVQDSKFIKCEVTRIYDPKTNEEINRNVYETHSNYLALLDIRNYADEHVLPHFPEPTVLGIVPVPTF